MSGKYLGFVLASQNTVLVFVSMRSRGRLLIAGFEYAGEFRHDVMGHVHAFVTTTAAIASSSIANSSEEDNDVMMKETLMGECAEEGKKSALCESGKCEWIRRGDCCSAAMEADPLVWLTFTARPRVSEKKGVRLFLKVA